MGFKVFWTGSGIFCFSRSANPLHDSMYKVWGKKIENLVFVSNALKMILKGFWTCFDDFWISKWPNPLHDSMYKVWGKKIQKIIFVS
jgi:hypothetical protein